mmetsp:Transcript_52015/g.146572  ORF Transcript_52015/g.146572 Transcript_52015/m.146572 type:complete len:414 (-) Transcript_52015:23-1264(-)
MIEARHANIRVLTHLHFSLHSPYVMAWLRVLLIAFTHATSDAIIITKELDATSSPTHCCVNDQGVLSAPTPYLAGFGGPAYCGPESHKIHFESNPTCDDGKWRDAKKDALAGLEPEERTLLTWIAEHHHKFRKLGADVLLKEMQQKLKEARGKRQKRLEIEARLQELTEARRQDEARRQEKARLAEASALLVAKKTCGSTFEFDSSMESQKFQASLAGSVDIPNAEATIKELPGCKLAVACDAAFRADAGMSLTWAVDCETLATEHTKCFEYYVSSTAMGEERGGMEWWFAQAYPNGHGKPGEEKAGNEQAREMLKKMIDVKKRAATFANEKLATTEGGNCVVAKEVPSYSDYAAPPSSYDPSKNLRTPAMLPTAVQNALTGIEGITGWRPVDLKQKLCSAMWEGANHCYDDA